EPLPLTLMRRAATRSSIVRSQALPVLTATLLALLSTHAHAECTLLQPEKSFALPEILNLPPDIDPAKPKQISGWYGLTDTSHPQFWCFSKLKISLRLQTASGTSQTRRHESAGA